MIKLNNIVREEATATRRLLDEIEIRQASSQYYDNLLVFLKNLCNEILELTKDISEYIGDKKNSDQKPELRNLLILGSYVVRQINSYCDSFEYAEILSVPTATMQLLNKLLKSVSTCKAFMVRGTTDFNYMYQPIGETLNNLAGPVSESIPLLENSFAILIFPIAYSKNVMANCNLIHELGHLIVDSEHLTNKLETTIVADKNKQIDEIIERHARLGIQMDFLFVQRKDKIRRILQNWIHELMADFIGIFLLGPCHLLSFIKLIEPMGSYQRDDDEHPCSSVRALMMIEILEKLGWEETIRTECLEVWKRAKEIAGKERSNQDYFDAAAECLPVIKDDILIIVEELCNDSIYKPETFKSVKDSIYGLLERGIPPAEKMSNSKEKDTAFDSIDAISCSFSSELTAFRGKFSS